MGGPNSFAMLIDYLRIFLSAELYASYRKDIHNLILSIGSIGDALREGSCSIRSFLNGGTCRYCRKVSWYGA